MITDDRVMPPPGFKARGPSGRRRRGAGRGGVGDSARRTLALTAQQVPQSQPPGRPQAGSASARAGPEPAPVTVTLAWAAEAENFGPELNSASNGG
jgi:hypothetical protein